MIGVATSQSWKGRGTTKALHTQMRKQQHNDAIINQITFITYEYYNQITTTARNTARLGNGAGSDIIKVK
jgi:hypothetical protein